MLKGLFNRLLGRKTPVPSRPEISPAAFAQVIGATEIQPWQEQVLTRLEETLLPQQIPVHAIGDTDWNVVVKQAIEEQISSGATSYNAIAKRLNAKGLLNHKGRPFNQPLVQRLIESYGIDFQTQGIRVDAPGSSQGYKTRKEKPAPAAKAVADEPSKAVRVRFRRTKQEIKLGLSTFDAMKRRKLAERIEKFDRKAKAKKKVSVTKSSGKNVVAKGQDVTDQIMAAVQHEMQFEPTEMMREPVRSRARAAMEFERKGRKDYSTAELDAAAQAEIARRVAAGEVTKLPAGLDSNGTNHFEEGRDRDAGVKMMTNSPFNTTGSFRARKAGVTA